MGNKKLTGTLIPKDNKKAKMHATFYSDKPIGDGGDSEIFDEYIDATDQQRNTALANVSNQTANSITGKMGHKVLDPTKTFAEQVTAENTIYEIRDVFDLGGTQETPVSVTLPAGSEIKFNGGMIKNCTVVGNNTSINAGNEQIFDNVKFSGSFIGNLNAFWIGAKPIDSTFDNSFVLQNWFDKYSSVFKTLEFPKTTYYFKSPVSLNTDTRFLTLKGNNSIFYTDIEDDANEEGRYFITIQGPQTSGTQGAENFIIDNIRICNNRKNGNDTISKTCAIRLNRTQRFLLRDVHVLYFDKAIHITDIFYGGFEGSIRLHQNRVGIYIDDSSYQEVNGIDFHNVIIYGCNNAVAKRLWPKIDRESDENYNMRVAVCGIDFHTQSNGCKFYGDTIEQCDYGIRFNWRAQNSQQTIAGDIINIDSCYFEGNRIYDIYVGKGYLHNPNNYSSYRVYKHNCIVTKNRFYNTGKCYFLYGENKFFDNQPANIELEGTGTGNGFLVYNGDISLSVGAYSAAIKDSGVYGSTHLSNSYQQLTNLAKQSLVITTSNLGLQDSGDYNTNTPIAIPNESNFGIYPTLKTSDVIMALRGYSSKDGSTFIDVPSGAGYARVLGDRSTYRRIINVIGLNLREFLNRWNNGTSYTGKVQGLFPNTITADPSTGLIKDSNDNIVGFGSKALIDGTYPKPSTGTAKTYYYVFVDALIYVICRVFNGSRYYATYCDFVECSRLYREVAPSASSTTLNAKVKFFGNSTARSSVIPHINKVFFDTTENKTKIYNGTEWIDLVNPWTRYVYSEVGNLSSRATIPDYIGQQYYNKATGIRYTFCYGNESDYSNPTWLSSIGHILSLEHPNGYNSTSNPVEYATELSAGEMVMYNGSIIKWDGTQFVNLDGTSLS